jgi:hypothetical protein
MACSKIEVVPPAQWSSQLLPQGFTKAARDALHMQASPPSAAFHDFVERAAAVLSSSASPQAKTNLLAFMEPLCGDDNAADALINTPLASALIANIESSNTLLRAQACHAFGLLVRHAKFIDMNYVGPGVLQKDVVVLCLPLLFSRCACRLPKQCLLCFQSTSSW